MSADIKQFLRNKKLPKFLSNSSILGAAKKVDKVFPSIGLNNSEKVLNETFTDLSEAQTLADLISDYIYSAYHNCQDSALKDLLTNLFSVASQATSIVRIENNKIALKLHKDVLNSERKVVFKRGESLFKVYGKLSSLPDLEKTPEFKRFSANNIGGRELKIVFSSDIWDIATMSMRGISTCQQWNGEHKAKLIGSILDPFTGIIYLTTGSQTDLGSKMIRRSVVRYIIDNETKKPSILIDRIYPDSGSVDDIMGKFKAFIAEKTEGKFPIHTYYQWDIVSVGNKSYIPRVFNTEKLNDTHLSYRDTKIAFGRPKSKNNYAIIKSKFARALNKQAYNAIWNLKPQSNKKTDRVNKPDLAHILYAFYKDLARIIVDDTPIMDDNYTYYNKVLYHFILNRKELETKRITQLVKHINSYFGLKKIDRLSSKDLYPILAEYDRYICSALKAELKRRIEKKQSLNKNSSLALNANKILNA